MRKFSITIGFLLACIALLGGFLYRYAGLKSHISNMVYFGSIADIKEKNSKQNAYFGNSALGDYGGGTFAGSIGKTVFLWGRSSLDLYKTNENTVFMTFDNCAYLDSVPGSISRRIYESLSSWKDFVSTGKQVFVIYDEKANRLFGKTKVARKVITNMDYDVRLLKFCHEVDRK